MLRSITKDYRALDKNMTDNKDNDQQKRYDRDFLNSIRRHWVALLGFVFAGSILGFLLSSHYRDVLYQTRTVLTVDYTKSFPNADLGQAVTGYNDIVASVEFWSGAFASYAKSAPDFLKSLQTINFDPDKLSRFQIERPDTEPRPLKLLIEEGQVVLRTAFPLDNFNGEALTATIEALNESVAVRNAEANAAKARMANEMLHLSESPMNQITKDYLEARRAYLPYVMKEKVRAGEIQYKLFQAAKKAGVLSKEFLDLQFSPVSSDSSKLTTINITADMFLRNLDQKFTGNYGRTLQLVGALQATGAMDSKELQKIYDEILNAQEDEIVAAVAVLDSLKAYNIALENRLKALDQRRQAIHTKAAEMLPFFVTDEKHLKASLRKIPYIARPPVNRGVIVVGAGVGLFVGIFAFAIGLIKPRRDKNPSLEQQSRG